MPDAHKMEWLKGTMVAATCIKHLERPRDLWCSTHLCLWLMIAGQQTSILLSICLKDVAPKQTSWQASLMQTNSIILFSLMSTDMAHASGWQLRHTVTGHAYQIHVKLSQGSVDFVKSILSRSARSTRVLG